MNKTIPARGEADALVRPAERQLLVSSFYKTLQILESARERNVSLHPPHYSEGTFNGAQVVVSVPESPAGRPGWCERRPACI
jgi:hypothetical protein